jgi:hypothetical protein
MDRQSVQDRGNVGSAVPQDHGHGRQIRLQQGLHDLLNHGARAERQ